ncbi:MAG TPA: nuclear transport factor 2 family protein [Solirubrobacterales bacterium]
MLRAGLGGDRRRPAGRRGHDQIGPLGEPVPGDGRGDPTPELSRLVAAYASAVDRRDLAALRNLFLPDATLTVRRGDAQPEVRRGHEGLAGVIEMLGQFEATLHEVSGLLLEWDDRGEDGADGEQPVGGDVSGAEARGVSVCVAHHITCGEGGEGSDVILNGRYSDVYRRDESGAFRFAARELRVLWTEKRPVRLA